MSWLLILHPYKFVTPEVLVNVADEEDTQSWLDNADPSILGYEAATETALPNIEMVHSSQNSNQTNTIALDSLQILAQTNGFYVKTPQQNIKLRNGDILHCHNQYHKVEIKEQVTHEQENAWQSSPMKAVNATETPQCMPNSHHLDQYLQIDMPLQRDIIARQEQAPAPVSTLHTSHMNTTSYDLNTNGDPLGFLYGSAHTHSNAVISNNQPTHMLSHQEPGMNSVFDLPITTPAMPPHIESTRSAFSPHQVNQITMGREVAPYDHLGDLFEKQTDNLVGTAAHHQHQQAHYYQQQQDQQRIQAQQHQLTADRPKNSMKSIFKKISQAILD